MSIDKPITSKMCFEKVAELSYKSPIDLCVSQMRMEHEKRIEGDIYRAIHDVGIFVDKDELIKALQYDRDKYSKGFHDGYKAAAGYDKDVVEVVRCKDCINAKPYERADGETGYYCQNNNSTFRYGTNWERLYEPTREANDYCSYGERKDECESKK